MSSGSAPGKENVTKSLPSYTPFLRLPTVLRIVLKSPVWPGALASSQLFPSHLANPRWAPCHSLGSALGPLSQPLCSQVPLLEAPILLTSDYL